MENPKVHPNFKINGKSILEKDIIEVAYSLIKEGELYQQSIGDFLLDWVDDSKTVSVKTSGSTGTPKNISLLKEHMRNSALATGQYFGLMSNNTCLLCLPCEYIAGKMMLVRAMVLGLDIYITEPRSHPLEQIAKPENFDFCAMVPMQVQSSLKDLDRIKKLIVGGAPISYDLRSSLASLKTKVYETYGMTETITHVAIKEVKDGIREDYFKALPGVNFSKDNRGCLVIDASEISQNQVITNDMVELISETEFKWLGRYDNVINSGGIKLIPEVIENKLSSFLDVPYVVAGIHDDILGQKIILIVETDNPNKVDLNKLNVINGLKPYERPKDIVYLKEFVRTSSNKIQRKLTLKNAINN